MESKIVKSTKNVVVGFFVLVFIMGFFSRSVINLFLPKVAVEPALEGAVQRTLYVEGVIEAKNTFQVRLSGEAIVEEFLVKNGEQVAAGKPLFRINKDYGLKNNALDIERLRLQIESYRLRINNLRQDSDQIELKNISTMEAKLEKSKQELVSQQAMFDAGAISKQELDNYIEKIEQQNFDIEIAKLNLDKKRRQSMASIQELEGQMKSTQLQIRELEGKQAFYGQVDDEGLYYSEVNGIVVGINQVQSILPRDTVIIEIAETGERAALVYVTEIFEKDYNLVKEAGSIQINGEDALSSEFLKIASVYFQGDRGLYKVECTIPDKGRTQYSVGQKQKGVVKQKYVIDGAAKVSKSALVVYGEYKAGSKGYVYLLERKEGILGKELRAKEVPVEILAVGDNEVIVSGLEKIEKPEVILNLSYKIRDGVKVFLWQ